MLGYYLVRERAAKAVLILGIIKRSQPPSVLIYFIGSEIPKGGSFSKLCYVSCWVPPVWRNLAVHLSLHCDAGL